MMSKRPTIKPPEDTSKREPVPDPVDPAEVTPDQHQEAEQARQQFRASQDARKIKGGMFGEFLTTDFESRRKESRAAHKEISRRAQSQRAENAERRRLSHQAWTAKFFSAARYGVPTALEQFLHNGFDVNTREAGTGATALHYAAAASSRAAVLVLISHDGCDYLVRDALGRLPSELADLYGTDPVVTRLLKAKEAYQARKLGLPNPRRRSNT